MSDASDADRLEQELPVEPDEDPLVPSGDPEAPEADAVEQALPAPWDDADDHR